MEEEVTVRRVVEAEMVEISEKREVEEAKMPFLAQMGEVVAAEITAKFDSQVKGSAPPAAVASVPQVNTPAFQLRVSPASEHSKSPAPKRLVDEAVEAKKVPVEVALPLMVDEAEARKPPVKVERLVTVSEESVLAPAVSVPSVTPPTALN